MFDLTSYINRLSYEAKVETPTDSHSTTIVAEGKKSLIRKVYDVEGVLRANEEVRSDVEAANGFNDSKEWRWIGSIPSHVAVKIAAETEGDPFEMSKRLKKYLRENPEFALVRPRTF